MLSEKFIISPEFRLPTDMVALGEAGESMLDLQRRVILLSQKLNELAGYSADIQLGEYTGTGAAQTVSGIGWAPNYLKIWTKTTTDGAAVAIYETTSEMIGDHASGMAINVGAAVAATGRITALTGDGFKLAGTSAPNASGQDYRFLAMR